MLGNRVPAELPSPEPQALAASRALLERIGAELGAAGNWISFARYMELVLYEPGLGYYASGARKLGAGGDFITAPELSPLFARSLARQVRQVLGPDEAVLEFGAGSGALAEVLLDELNIVLRYDYLPLREVLDVLKNRPIDKHIVITGRNAKQELIEIADLVTEMELIKHPFRSGVKAQAGIEF